MIMGWWWWWWGWWTWGPMWNYWWSWWWWWYSYSWWLPADYIPVDMNTGHVNKMHELLTNRRGHIWWSHCIVCICFVHQTSNNTIIIIIVIFFYSTALSTHSLPRHHCPHHPHYPPPHHHYHHNHSLDHNHHGSTQLRWTCNRSPLSPHPTSDRRRRPPWRESRIVFFLNWYLFLQAQISFSQLNFFLE